MSEPITIEEAKALGYRALTIPYDTNIRQQAAMLEAARAQLARPHVLVITPTFARVAGGLAIWVPGKEFKDSKVTEKYCARRNGIAPGHLTGASTGPRGYAGKKAWE